MFDTFFIEKLVWMILFSVVGKDCSRDQGYKILSQILNSLKEKKKKNLHLCWVMVVIRALGPILKYFNLADSEFHLLKGSLALVSVLWSF